MDTFIKTYCNHPTQRLYHKIKYYLHTHPKYQTLIAIGILISLSLAFSIYTYAFEHNRIYLGDAIFHSTRVHEIHQDFLHGQFPLVVTHSSLPQGIATNIFYPWLTLAPILLVTMWISSPILLYILLIFVIEATRYLIAYYSYHAYDSSKWHSFIFALLYGTSISSTYWLWQSEDIGASLALAFLPLAFYGFISLMQKGHWKMMTIGVILTAYSHVITTLLITLFLGLLTLLNHKAFNRAKWMNLGKAIIVGLILTAGQWLPMLMIASQNQISYPQTNTPGLFAKGLIFYSNNGLGIFLPILAMITAASPRKHTYFDKQMYLVLTGCILVNIRLVGYILYTLFPFVLIIQYASRLGCLGNLAGMFVLMKYLCHHVRGHKSKERLVFNKFLVLIPIILLDIANISIQPMSVSHQTKTLTRSYRRVLMNSSLKKQRLLLKQNVHSITEPELQWNIHEPFYFDYSPSKNAIHWTAVYRQKPYSYASHRFINARTKSTDKGVQVSMKKTQHNVEVPITYYHGIKYSFTKNGKYIDKNNINWKLSNNHQRIVVKTMPKGKNIYEIKHAELKW